MQAPTYPHSYFQSWYDNPLANTFGLQVVAGSGPFAPSGVKPPPAKHGSHAPQLPANRHH